jgi:hypothetical protein
MGKLFGRVFDGLGFPGDDKNAQKDASSGNSQNHDGAAEGLTHMWGGAGGTVSAEAASLGAGGQGQGEGEREDHEAEPHLG